MRVVEKSAKTREMATEEALRELNASRDQVIIEVLDEGKEGILGIFGARDAKVRVTLKDDKKTLAGELLENMLRLMNIPCKVTGMPSEDANQVTLLIDGENVGNVIGKRGTTLNSIQYLLNVMVNKEGTDKINVSIDASGYRESRVKSLEELSLKLAQKVKETNRSVELEPMTSQERKVIHMTLKNNTEVYTYSKGEEPYRKVVISAKNKERSGNGGGNNFRGPKRRPSSGGANPRYNNRPRPAQDDAENQPAAPQAVPAPTATIES